MSKPGHHLRKELCLTRAPYREGRKPTAVKVYTVNQESKYLIVQGVPSIGAKADLMKLFSSHGDVDQFRMLNDYPSETFTNAYLISYKRIQSARVAKRRLDDWSFFGGVLHICYAPEYETTQETREKLQERRRTIAAKIKQYNRDGTYSTGQSQSTSVTDSKSHTQVELETGQSNIPTGSLDTTGVTKVNDSQGQGQMTCYNGVTLNSQNMTLNSPSSYQQVNSADSFINNHHGNMAGGIGQFSSGQFNGQPGQRSAKYSGHSVHVEPQGQRSMTSDLDGQHGQRSRTQDFSNVLIPPPPKELNINMRNNQQRQHQNYSFARVRSSQAAFPPNFDGRLVKPEIKSVETGTFLEETTVDLDDEETVNERLKTDDATLLTEANKSMQEKINENLKQDKVVIKDFTSKKGTVPKFIPRQMQNKKKTSLVGKAKLSEADEVSKDLRRNAFTLRDVQGPAGIQEVKKDEPELQISSVEKSVKEIRKHITQFSDRSVGEPLAKRKKTTDS